MLGLIGLWAFALAALLYGGLAIWQMRGGGARALVAAFAAIACWAAFNALSGIASVPAWLAESGRNLALLLAIRAMIRGSGAGEGQRPVRLVYAAVAATIGVQAALAVATLWFATGPAAASIDWGLDMLGLTVAAGSLVLVHNLYGQASPASRAQLQLAVIALAALWAYDLHLYTYQALTGDGDNPIAALRGAVTAMLAPLFLLAGRGGGEWRVQLSRSATFQSLSLIAILFYLIVMMSLTRAMERFGGGWTDWAQLGLVAVMTGLALLVLPSARARAWLQVMVSKHFFEHRYDYREDWLRFTRAVAGRREEALELGERVVKAMCEIAGARGGLLLALEDGARLAPAAQWNWSGEQPAGVIGGEAREFLETSSHVIDFASSHPLVPAWLAKAPAWAGIALVHDDHLVGIVLLDHPPQRRALDWEDFDLFRTAGIQAASYISEARGQEALAEAQRFDEFNRRFAFIMHDIKNLVSQLSLVARNAERHADNPDFQADMVATLQASVKKMNDLIARLSRAPGVEAEPARPMLLHPLLARLVEAKARQHPVTLRGDARIMVRADSGRLEQAIGHLVQNAIDASPAGEAVEIAFARRGAEVAIDVVDKGCGMSAEFIRTRLFRPFASTKEGGFGVGAFEARALVTAMGGRIEASSREGQGSRFTIFLPKARAEAAPQRRMRA